MEISDDICISRLTVADIEAGLALSGEAGWNQTGDDWRHFIEHGITIGVRAEDGRLVASAAALPYEGRLGYVAMVLVTDGWRRRGIATRLVKQCVDALSSIGRVAMLDATEAGEGVYKRQGFETVFKLDRWQGEFDNGKSQSAGSQPNIPRIVELDGAALGANRPRLIEDFLARPRTDAILSPDANGFAMAREGRRAIHLGPVVADTQSDAIAMIGDLINRLSGKVYIDVRSACIEAGQWLSSAGFTVQRSFSRMAYGQREAFGQTEKLIAGAGPEFG